MILDRLTCADRYLNVHPGVAAGLNYLSTGAWRELPLGKHALDGERLLIIVEAAQGKGTAAKLEAHERYIDIQLCWQGAEKIGWRPTSECRTLTAEYNTERDIKFFSDAPTSWLELQGDTFAVFFPDDAHAPLAGESAVGKAIMKVRYEWNG